jgi:RNA polymerase sigma factor (sigma-70 family)
VSSTDDRRGPVRSDSGAARASESSREHGLLSAARGHDRRARARLVAESLPLVRGVASRYRDYGVPFDDLVQEGSIGLLDAIDDYDEDRGASFEAYARFRVRRAIRNALTDQARLIRLPKHIVERRRAIERAEASLVASGRQVTTPALAAVTGLSVAAVQDARAAANARVSLDEPLRDDGAPLESLIADPVASDPATATLTSEQGELLARALDGLTPRQRAVVRAQWGLDGAPPATAVEVARELGLSPRRTQTIGQDALFELRDALELVGARR